MTETLEYILSRIPDLTWSEFSDPITALCDRLQRAEKDRDDYIQLHVDCTEEFVTVLNRIVEQAEKWEHVNDAYRAKPRTAMRYYLEPEDAAKALRKFLED